MPEQYKIAPRESAQPVTVERFDGDVDIGW